MNLGFLMSKPFPLMMDKFIGLVGCINDRAIIKNLLRMRKRIFDRPHQAGQAFHCEKKTRRGRPEKK